MVVRPPGFEPGIAGLEGLHQMSVSYQARPQPHNYKAAVNAVNPFYELFSM